MELAHRLVSTRRGTMILGGVAAVIAGVAVYAYVHNYRSSVKSGGTAATVLVARNLIPKGTPGELVATKQLFAVSSVRESQLREGAFSDATGLAGRVAATDILPGQQLTAADFTAGSTSLSSSLRGPQRAIAIPIDHAHGMIGNLVVGDHVDVYAVLQRQGSTFAGGSVLTLLTPNVPVVGLVKSTSGSIGAQTTTEVDLKLDSNNAANLAFSSDEGKVWLVLRPPAGAAATPPNRVTVQTILSSRPFWQLGHKPTVNK